MIDTAQIQTVMAGFGGHMSIVERRPGIQQLMIPIYHEDGDMVDVYLQPLGNAGRIRICDFGMTLMRLSYSFDLDSENKNKILASILAKNGIGNEGGNLFYDCDLSNLYPAILQFAYAMAKVTAMEEYRRETIKSLFLENIRNHVYSKLMDYSPRMNVKPIEGRDDLEVDYVFDFGSRPIFMFAVKDTDKARITTIACLEFMRKGIPFRSLAVHHNFEDLSSHDRSRITSAVDKQYPTPGDFESDSKRYFEREAA